ncbi:MAG: ATP-dependent DNA helicase [Opitutales bacterium]
MEIHSIEREVRLSVGELANFRIQPQSGIRRGGHWRAQVGQQWHKESATQIEALHPDARFEETIAGTLLHADWTFHIQGRIDQLIPEKGTVTLREVKTIHKPLPAHPEELFSEFPEYFAQAAIYLRIAQLLERYDGQALRGEILFISIDDGSVQSVPIDKAKEALPERQLDKLVSFLDDRRSCRKRLDAITIQPAFQKLRDGQNDLIEQLAVATLRSKVTLLQAPTGFGKTGIVLEHALRKMQEGHYQRCLYLTSKSTGQLETVRQLQRIIGHDIRFIQMRNRKEHRIDSPKHRCSGDRRCDDELGRHWLEADIHPPDLFAGGTLTLDRAKQIGNETGVCPYALTKACLPYAEVWIGDSNYLFAPASRQVFTETYGFNPAETLVIIDEAHNLPSRNADALSVSLDAGELVFAIEALRAAGAQGRLLAGLDALVSEIERLRPGNPLNPDEIYSLCDLCEESASLIQEARVDYQMIAPFALEIIWRIPELAGRMSEAASKWLYWCRQRGTVQASCLDASEWTSACLKPFGGSILMSATLDPVDDFLPSLGCKAEEASLVLGHAAWRENAYDVAMDCRVGTRLKERSKYYETTARTIVAAIHARPSAPTAVFFPSYQYAENVREYLSAIDFSLRIALQERGLDLPEQEDFIDQALISSDALFLIIGSSYAEGIDKLGGQIDTIVVVGPALPEVNPIQQAKMDARPELDRECNFERVYIIPAMRRIHQALGRIVRAPGQRAKVLLHGKRYLQEQYSKHLQPEYTAGTIIKDTDTLQRWLSD